MLRRQREHQAGNKAPLITGRVQAGQRLWTGSALLFELAAGHLVAVGDEVVGLGEGLPVNDKLARDLVALQRLVPRHVVDLGPDAGPQLGRIFLPVSFCMPTARSCCHSCLNSSAYASAPNQQRVLFCHQPILACSEASARLAQPSRACGHMSAGFMA